MSSDLYQKHISRAYDTSAAPSGIVPDASAGGYTTGTTVTNYMGQPAYRILTVSEKLTIPAGLNLPQPLDFQENGVIAGFTVAVNDPLFQVNCVLYGQDNSQTVLNDRTMVEVTALGRGLTQGAAEATGPQGQSLDPTCVKDDIWPYIQRYRGTFSLPAILAGSTYNQVRGTLDDKWIVLSYAPSIKEGYTRFTLDIINRSSNNRMIHLMQISRIKFQSDIATKYTTGSSNFAEQKLSFT